MLPSWPRSLLRRPTPIRRTPYSIAKRRFRPSLEALEARETPATGFVLSGFPLATTAGVAGNLSVVAVNSDGSTDTAYSGKVHFASSDPKAILPADVTLNGGAGTFSVAFKTAGTQTLTVTDTVNSSITGSLGTATSGTGFTQSFSGTGGLIASSWLNPDGSDADMYAYDNFTLPTNQSITEIDWRGGYIYNALYGKANNFTVTIFDSILGGSQPLVNNPQLPETYLAKYNVGGNAGETYAGSFGGVTMYDYKYALKTPFQAAGGHTYWVRIEAEQVGYPDWGIAVGTGGNGQHFQFSTGAARFSYASGDEAFTLITKGTAGVIVSPAATSQFVFTSFPGNVTAGAAVNLTATAEDPYGNVTPAYTGTVHFASSDAQAVLPIDTYISSGNKGKVSFTATFGTAGPQSLNVADLYNGAVAAAQANLTVNPAAAVGLSFVNFPTIVPAGVPESFTLAAVDAYGNVATGYRGTIGFASSDAQAVLPSNYQFTAGDQGQHTFTATLTTPGAQSFSATDSANALITGSVFTAGQTALFNFDSPGLQATMGMPSTLTVGGVTASFNSPNAWLSGGFSLQSANTTFFHLSQFSGNYLYPNSVYNPDLAIAFNQPISSLTFTYATADFGQNETPTTVQVIAYLGSTMVGSASSHGIFYLGDTMPEGTLTFDGAGQTFDHVLIQIPPAPLAASDMLIDNISVTTPDVNGVVVTTNAPVQSTPTLVVGGDVFTYDGLAHAATALAVGVDGVSPVNGSFALTYNGSTTLPTDAGVYTVQATFTSTDPNYGDATGAGTLIINAAPPSIAVTGGTFIYDGLGHGASANVLGIDGVTPVSGSVALTYNGSATLPTAAGTYTVLAAFTSGDPNYSNATGAGTLVINAALPSIAVTGGTYTYDSLGHGASVSIMGVDGVTPVSGNMTLTYNGGTAQPTAAGSYTVLAAFTSSDPNYGNATVTGSITINPATPAFSNLSSPSIAAGTATTVLSGHLAAGSLSPVGANVSVTLNGVTRTATVDASGNFAASFATGTLPAGSYAITYAFAGDGANFGSAANGSGTLTATAVKLQAPKVTTQPLSQTVTAGNSATFTAAATGSPTPTVQWQVSSNGGGTWTNLAGATSTTLTFVTSATQNGYRYRAVFTNSAGTATTSSATLTVQSAPVVTLNPLRQTVLASHKVSIKASAAGNPTPTVQWQVSTNGGSTWTNISGATSTTLSFVVSATQNGYQYRALFTNKIGTATTKAAVLTV